MFVKGHLTSIFSFDIRILAPLNLGGDKNVDRRKNY